MAFLTNFHYNPQKLSAQFIANLDNWQKIKKHNEQILGHYRHKPSYLADIRVFSRWFFLASLLFTPQVFLFSMHIIMQTQVHAIGFRCNYNVIVH